MKYFLSGFLVFLILIEETNAQVKEFENWKRGRVTELTSEDGWINLVGLMWYNGQNSFLNQISADSLALSDRPGKNNIGVFRFSPDSAWFEFNAKLAKKSNLQPPFNKLVYPAEYGKGGIYFDHWKWTVIERGGQFAVRLRDLTHPGLGKFEGIPVFDYNPIFRVKAFFEPKFNETMEIPNVLGQVIEWKVMGILKFNLDGETYELTALDEAGRLFVIFSDATSGNETYPTGRYLYVKYPDKTGMTEIDFNFSYNPPCAFTAFATCPIPPKVNRLPLALRVGEKVPKGH
ncbi:DUF1684 domain-containing protein [Algoriphagus sp. AK58]|uniref:DUF1684 domain-containing protein n=1 Tax=Algoriphagus sp. AK58 TaxID=1406877 RepID=UPI00164F881D|nr:DUF1684 domain-containing protein [Algoriphagus sp. AK58]MBC6366102.1 hypothetical protein [Algoriphagus sp. AK58]